MPAVPNPCIQHLFAAACGLLRMLFGTRGKVESFDSAIIVLQGAVTI